MPEIPISLFIDDELIGSGNLIYSDESKIALLNQAKRICDETPIVDGNDEEIGAIEYCHDDIVSSWLPGARTVKYDGPAYDDRGNVIGHASFEHEDRYSMSLAIPLAVLLLLILLRR